MAMLGTGSPKWVFDRGGGSEFTILFDYIYDHNFEPKTIYVEHESELDIERDFILKGSHWTFDFKMNLYKYSDDLSVVLAKHDEINDYKGQKGTLWMHRDGSQFKKSDGSDALFVLKEIIPFYRETRRYKDALYIKFESCSPVDLGQGSSSSYQLANIVMSNDF